MILRPNSSKIACLPLAGLIALAVLHSGCVQLAEVDSSSSPAFASVVGTKYRLKSQFLALGVKRDLRSKKPDYGMIVPPPGVGGPEFFDFGTVPAGSVVKIVGVVTHASKLFPKTEYVVNFEPDFSRGGISEFRIYNVHAWKTYIDPKNGGPLILSPEYFQELNPGDK